MIELSTSKYDTFIDVLLPLAVNQAYTYRVPSSLSNSVHIGSRVVVPFHGNRLYTAIVSSVHNKAPIHYEAKYIINILDETPVVLESQINFWRWLADYYLCNIGDVMNAALPSAMKLSSESNLVINQSADYDKNELSEQEYLIVEAIEVQGGISINDVQKILDIKTVMPIIKNLINKGYIYLLEEIQEKYKAKTRSIIELNSFYTDVNNLKSLFSELESKPKQVDALQAFLRLSKSEQNITSKMLIEEAAISSSVINTLIKKEVFIKSDVKVSRLVDHLNEDEVEASFQLNTEQLEVLNNILLDDTNTPALIHGVTSSGKTMVFIELIKEQLKLNQQVLILIPEIGLTTQLIERYKIHFNENIAVYHSKYSEKQRVEIWQNVLSGKSRIILGTRSSIFLPFQSLNLIIVDEEHDSSYKQNEPNPRYNARDCAIYLANIFNAKIILGSATPSMESYFNALNGKYHLHTLKNRFGTANLPKIQLVPAQNEFPKENLSAIIGKTLQEEIKLRLERKEQVILFQNRRGYAPYLQCTTCGHTPYCVNCDVGLTYHKWSDELRCHYCGFHSKVMKVCVACGAGHMELKGHGTEKIEDELKELFPDARVARMDLDTTRKKNAYQELLDSIENAEIDILVGTQMVTKGLDFNLVTLVGILQADSLLNHQDFRAHERAFQLIEQVSGRAGRRDIQGQVIIQTFKPDHPILQLASRHDYDLFLRHQLNERKQFKYPPYCRVIEILVKHKEMKTTQLAAIELSKEIKKFIDGASVLGPEFPVIGKVRNQYINRIVLKLDRKGKQLLHQKNLLRNAVIELKSKKNFKSVNIVIDVDPM
ncbi:MAG: primosomal protein N' [bacterium]|jgi:primosomal protein N' (replication factor Y)